MNKSLSHFLITIILAFALSFILPWWSVMLAALAIGILLPLRGMAAFFIPFLAIALLWIGHAAYLSGANDFILAQKVAVLLPLGGQSILLLLITGLIGGLAAGFAGLLGQACVQVFGKN